jgi:MurNAc alpha-1-phosphate uridylyltransferase
LVNQDFFPKVAMVFAAGFGKRMQPLTNKIPKPLVSVCGKTLIDYALDNLACSGVNKAVVNTHHLSDLLKEHLNNRGGLPKIAISHEEVILETGGGIVKALLLLGSDPIFTMNSDVILLNRKTNALQRMAKEWDSDKMDVLMLLQPVEQAIGYDGDGDFNLSPGGSLIQDSCKDKEYVFTGVMLIKPELFNNESVRPFSVYKDFIRPKYMRKDGSFARVFGIVHDGFWLHIGTCDAIIEAENFINKIVE